MKPNHFAEIENQYGELDIPDIKNLVSFEASAPNAVRIGSLPAATREISTKKFVTREVLCVTLGSSLGRVYTQETRLDPPLCNIE
jgi:hypothetical protein